MSFETCYDETSAILMEGAIGERLKREYSIVPDETIALASLIYDSFSRQAICNIYQEYIEIARKYRLPFIATTPTRRANKERVRQSGFTEKIIEDNVRFLKEIKMNSGIEMFIGGLMGCKGDAYKATDILSIEDACQFHSWQADVFKASGVDFLFAGIMPALPEAVGMAKAMEDTELPYIISFMIKEDGKLIDGTTIHDAIYEIDNATRKNPICYMTNCVHPIILRKALSKNDTLLVKKRFCGIQANASPLSPEELNDSTDLKTSDSIGLANEMISLYKYINPKIYGGCCGTDQSHIEEIAKLISA